MKKIIIGFAAALAMLTLASSVEAIIVKESCLNSTHQIDTYNYTEVLNNTATSYDYIQIHKCFNGCSSTLGKCRPNEYELHVSSFALIILIMAIGVLGVRYAGYYTPVVLMLILSLAFAVYSTDVFIDSDKLLILIVSLALIGMNTDEFLKYRDWKKYEKDLEE